ncbi:MAG: hypothetical protein Q8R37_05055 [Nanoarchaeota archaeon]|nr:hypothetical protein [Nanoarchaeota archaeon]
MMSLYSLDILIDKEGQKFVSEINGINSGMIEEQTEKKVYALLKEKYGTLTVNSEVEQWKQFQKHHWFRSFFVKVKRYLEWKGFLSSDNDILYSEKAYHEWVYERSVHGSTVSFPFEFYHGQNSTVINSYNQLLPHPLVNNYIAEEISRNKFFQYWLMKDSPVGKYFPPAALVGLGWGDENELRELQEKDTFFVIKPLLGCQGKGVRIINTYEIDRFMEQIGPLTDKADHTTLSAAYFSHIINNRPFLHYLENYAAQGIFAFENGMAVIQPFIRSKMEFNSETLYSSIRAIICNGQFVDAYARLSPDPVCNISRSAIGQPYYDDDLPSFCSDVITALEEVAVRYEPESFRQNVYNSYFNEKGRRRSALLWDNFGFPLEQLQHLNRIK